MERIPEFPSVGFPNDSNPTPNGGDTVCVIIGLADQAASAPGHALLSELIERGGVAGWKEEPPHLKGGEMSRSGWWALHIAWAAAILIA